MFKAFITGSRAYGTPRPDSDLDLVVCVEDFGQEVLIHSLSDNPTGATKFGRLNLIMLDPDKFEKWRQVNEELVARRPVTRDEAIEALEAGGVHGSPSGEVPSVDGEEASLTELAW